ncbi:hypothetical protein BC834DRAFT_824867 [Gloeopeniophorella convolvens]|nr:hypothetical protein BC834DRAFT_824867 [Gloeopeniophorella convolvens]
MNSVPLVLPFTLASSTLEPEGHPDTPLCSHVLVNEASSIANVTCITHWSKTGPTPSPGQQNVSFDALEGVALGCEDGTLYLLHQNHRDSPLPVTIEKPLSSGSPSPPPARRAGRSRSRPRTPTSSLSPLSLSSRARAVSGISDEPVQAPKNYVDFDEEPEKLKEMLKGGSRDTAPPDRFTLSFDRGPVERQPLLSKGLSSPTGSVRWSEAKSLLSATHSPALSIASLPSLASHSGLPSPSHPPYHLSLGCHIFPPRSGVGNAVVELHSFANGRYLASLQSQGDLSIFAVKDGSCILSSQIGSHVGVPPPGAKEVPSHEAAWTWRRLFIHETAESSILLACASLDEGLASQSSPDNGEGNGRRPSRVALFELRNDAERGDDERLLDKSAEWLVDGPSVGLGLCADGDDSLNFFYVDLSNHLILQRVVLVPTVIQSEPDFPEDSSSNGALASLNPFKTGHGHSQEHLAPSEDRKGSGRILLEDLVDVGELKLDHVLRGVQVRSAKERIRGAVWSDSDLYGFEYDSRRLLIHRLEIACEGLKNITWFGLDTYCAVYSDRVDILRQRLVDSNNDRVVDKRSPGFPHAHVIATTPIHAAQALRLLSPTAVLSTAISSGRRRKVVLHTTVTSAENRKEWTSTNLWKSNKKETKPAGVNKRITCMLPLELTQFILGYSDGTLTRSSFAGLVRTNVEPSPEDSSDIPLNAYMVCLHLTQNDRTGERLIVGGADDGSVAIWSLETLKMLARWTLFISPLERVLHLRHDKGGPLRGCLLCISGDGTIAVIALDEYHFLYMVPGAPAPLSKIFTSGDNLLLSYRDDRARLWDVKTLEFWRSMNAEKAEELLGKGGWTELSVSSPIHLPPAGHAPMTLPTVSPDAASTILVDLEPFLARAISISKSTAGDENKARVRTAGTLRALIQTLLTPGLNTDIDSICKDKLGLFPSPVSVGQHRNGSSSVIISEGPQGSWSVSGEASASRALALIACLRVLTYFEEVAEHVNMIITFYATSLSHTVGKAYAPPSLPFLAKWWFDVTGELRLAARTLFDAGVAGLTDEETVSLVERWQHSLPFLLSESERRSSVAAKALLLCGFVAAGQHELLSTSALNIISKSVMVYLHESDASRKALAIDLCSRGFDVWQHYIDAMEMLRCLFSLAASVKKESISAQNVGPQARQAVLHIVSHNTALFMTTLSLDILHPQSLEHRKSVMQLVAFLIRKKPLVIHPNLPKLVEAVVKSLDPNSTSNRDAVLDAATEILGHVVKTFPTVDFHMASQRLAVGTSEGAIVMYDLKTATRLYVLESHKKAPAACSFSPDGRRLVTVSLDEGLVLVWKVGTSFTSFFYPGAPPRQGHGGSEPYKSLSFNVGDEAVMNLAETLENVRFEWAAERSVQLKIRGVTLTFST